MAIAASKALLILLYTILLRNTREYRCINFLVGKKNKKLITDYTVSIGDPEKMANDALKIKKAGYSVIKVKLGENTKIDVERIKTIRKVIGKKIPIRIDANQGWDVKTAIKILKALKEFNIQYCEEPIPRWDFMNLKKVNKKSPIPVMADESCCDHHDAKRLIQLHACDTVSYTHLTLPTN